MLTHVVRRPMCHALSEPKQAGRTARSEQMLLQSEKKLNLSLRLQQRWDLHSRARAHQSAGHRSARIVTDDSVRTGLFESNPR
jgi:hypothetical protein